MAIPSRRSQVRHSLALALHRQLARDPALFAEVIAAIYRAHSENTAEEHTTTEQETLRASVAYDLLSSWHTMPGAMPDGSIDAAVLNAWVDDAMARCIACDRQAVGEQQIGQVLACSPNGEDGVWPCAPVRDLVERIRSRDVERGISIGKFNERGVVMKAPTEGGARERAIATQYTAYAIALGITHPRTAGMLRQLAAGYERDARREADRAEQRDLD